MFGIYDLLYVVN